MQKYDMLVISLRISLALRLLKRSEQLFGKSNFAYEDYYRENPLEGGEVH